MDPKLRVVTRLPLEELWDDNGVIVARGDRFNPVSNLQFGEPSGALAGRVVEFQARFSF